MSKQTIAVIVGALVLFVVAVVGAMAFTGNSDSGGNIHTMPGGATMTDEMTTDGSMTDATLP
jgi:hypothetical protein